MLSKDGEAVVGRASDPMTSIKAQIEHEKSKLSNKRDPYEFLDESDGEGSCTEKLSASDLMMEPGTLSKQKLDTADLRLLDSEESERNEEFRNNASSVPMAFPSTGEGKEGRTENNQGTGGEFTSGATMGGYKTNLESAESRINQLRE